MPLTQTSARPYRRILAGLHVGTWSALMALVGSAVPAAEAATSVEAFSRLQQYVAQQIQTDKKAFVLADACTQWFYKQLQQQPAAPTPEPVSSRPGITMSSPVQADLDCARRYPGGLGEAREDFRSSQEALTISLTFYEFVLVADADDDDAYSTAELQDMMDAVAVPFNALNSPAGHVDIMAGQFDLLRRERQLDTLMQGMSALYDKGYRLSRRDQAEVNRMSG